LIMISINTAVFTAMQSAPIAAECNEIGQWL
jgi:hypothetical protein